MPRSQPQNGTKGFPGRILRPLPIGAACALVGSLAAWGLFERAGLPSWAKEAVQSGLFVRCLVVFLAGAAMLSVLAAATWASAAKGRAAASAARRGQDGAAIVEFVMALPILLMLVLVMIQSSLLMAGNLCVHYSAYCAARGAIVYIPFDSSPTEPPNAVLGSPIDSYKRMRIKQAAVWALAPVSCGSNTYPAGDSGTLQDGLSKFFSAYGAETPGWVGPQLGRRLQYADDFTEIDLLQYDPAGTWTVIEDNKVYGEREDIHVRVNHTLYLSVPYANWLFATLDQTDGRKLSFGEAEYGMAVQALGHLTNEGVHDSVPIETFPGASP